eukprot:m.71435 g.71435  ORF g.71435 m.71435 type:complete len:170 (-) comp12244_c0_seq1:120-629(-)
MTNDETSLRMFQIGEFFRYREDAMAGDSYAIAEVRGIGESGPDDSLGIDHITDSPSAANTGPYIAFRLYYFPENTKIGRLPKHDKNEVLASWRTPRLRMDVFESRLINTGEPVSVITYREYCRMKAENAFRRDNGLDVEPCVNKYFVRTDFRDFELEKNDYQGEIHVDL